MTVREPKRRTQLPAVIADVGGTNARFAVLSADGRLSRPISVKVADYPTIDDAIRDLILSRTSMKPRSAVLALAGVARGDRIPLTNASWIVEPKRLVAQFGLNEVIALNDFEALALSLPHLVGRHLIPIGEGKRLPSGPRVVIGPGTGLGAAALVQAGGRWVPVRGEGGHMDLGPRTDRDRQLWPHLETIGGRVSAEWLVSGPGLLRLYQGLARSHGTSAVLARPEDISTAGLAGTDPLAVETLELFATYLGRYAGDVALTFMASGGVFIGGGIAPTLADVLKRGSFRAAFADKAPHSDIVRGFATAIIGFTAPAILGMAALLREPDSYAVGLDGRRWTR